jgi:hypothetical protein
MGVGIMRDLTLKRRDLNTSHTLGCTGSKNSKHTSGSSGHVDSLFQPGLLFICNCTKKAKTESKKYHTKTGRNCLL